MASRGFFGAGSSRRRGDKGKGKLTTADVPPPSNPSPQATTPHINLDDVEECLHSNMEWRNDEIESVFGPGAAADIRPNNDPEDLDDQPQPDTMPEAEEEIGGGTHTSRRGGRSGLQQNLRSDIFSVHFTREPDRSGSTGNYKVTCNYCKREYKFKHGGGYGTFTKHLNSKHPDKVGLDREQTQLGGFTQSQGTDASTPSAPLFKYSEANTRRNLAKYVSAMSLPFNHANNSFYEEFTALSFNPQSRQISRNTVTRDILKLVGEFKYALIQTFVELKQKISICVDIWQAKNRNDHYIGIIAHWIDDAWTMQKRVLAYREFNQSHTSQNIASKVIGILQEYQVDKKIFSIGFDNASANTASLPTLIRFCQPTLGGKFFHIRCICHCLNLCVQDGLQELNVHIEPIREAIRYIAKHTSVIKQWSRFCKSLGVRPKKFTLEVSTRWNSTYKLLNDSYEQRELLQTFFQQLDCGIVVFPTQWDICISLLSILRVFDEATRELSGAYYPTSPLAVDQCVKIALILSANESCPNLGPCVVRMKEKWLKYFWEIPDIFLVAKLLDPRIREDGLEELLTMYYTALFGDRSQYGSDDDEIPIPLPSVVVAQTKKSLVNIFREYKSFYGFAAGSEGVGDSSRGDASGGSQGPNPALSQFYNFYSVRTSKRARGGTDYEVETFLTTSFENIEFESTGALLKWWSRRAAGFPVLAHIAKEVFAAPASNVSVESAFSIGSYIMDVRRETMTVENFEAQVLLNDWTRAMKRQQDVDPDDLEEYLPDFYGYSTSTDSGVGESETSPPE